MTYKPTDKEIEADLNNLITVCKNNDIDAVRRYIKNNSPKGKSSITGDGWQTMESAPKDKTEILVYDDEGYNLVRWTNKPAYCHGDYDTEEGFGWYDENYFKLVPTHWQPMPKPPTVD